ncbi:MAG TPA: hypothetical protein VGK73_34600 [Polyangiaceae bacterium]
MNPGALTPVAEGVWIDSGPVRILGTHLTTTMTVLRLGDGSLLLESPLPMTPERRSAVEALGPVAHLYSPNLFHHLWLGEWAAAFPGARVHAPAGLAKKRPDLRIDRARGSEGSLEPAFAGVIDEVPIQGFRLEETVLFYRPAQTLLVGDLVHNVGRPADGWSKFYTRAMGFYDRVALSKALRLTAFSDRGAARRSLDRLLELPFERIVVGHGTPVTEGAKDALAAAYAWLPAVPAK